MAWQVFAYLGGMTAYAVHLLAGSALVPFACDIGTTLPVSALNWAMIAVAATSGGVAWRIWRAALVDVATSGAVSARRSAFLGFSGLLLDALAIVIILFVEAHVWVLDPCLP
jgi:hypothetical protein